MSDDQDELNTQGLDNLLKAFKGKLPTARIGILGTSGARTDKDGVTNATIGAAHEFGTLDLPQRSFLRVPISRFLGKQLEGSGFFNKDLVFQIMRDASLVPVMKKIGVMAEGVVLEAFDTGGFGQWLPSHMAHKKNKQTLVETQQLRNSITSDVKES